jgi:hypothetical protein
MELYKNHMFWDHGENLFDTDLVESSIEVAHPAVETIVSRKTQLPGDDLDAHWDMYEVLGLRD